MKCRFSIADICVSLESSDPKLTLATMPARQDFIVNETKPDSIVSAEWVDSLKEISSQPIFDSGALWKLYFDHEQYHFSFVSPVLGSQPYKIASFNQDFTRGRIAMNRACFNSGQNVDPLEYPLDELLILHVLSQGLGVEVHACGMIDPFQNGVLFLGQSGAGKTTMATFMNKDKQIKILSDDRIILRKKNGTIWMYGTPWHGESKFAEPKQIALRKIFFLKQSPRNEILQLKHPEAVARLFSCSFPLFYNSSAVNFMLSFFEEIVANVESFELRFVNNDEVIDFVNQSSIHLNYVETIS
jgi:hypothetical protein